MNCDSRLVGPSGKHRDKQTFITTAKCREQTIGSNACKDRRPLPYFLTTLKLPVQTFVLVLAEVTVIDARQYTCPVGKGEIVTVVAAALVVAVVL